MKPFRAKIKLIGINPYISLPLRVLNKIFTEAGKDKGKIPVKMTIDGHPFTQTLVRYSGEWRLYLNTPMRAAAKKETGNTASFTVVFNPDKKKSIKMHPQLSAALRKNTKAHKVFKQLAPSLQLEIIKYFSFLKTEESVERNSKKVIRYLLGDGPFLGRNLPPQ